MTRAIDDPVAYAKGLYRRSPKERLYRINATRERRGQPPLDSLDQAKLRKPLARSPMKPTPRKAPTAAEFRHLGRVAAMGCLVCDGPAEIHHVVSDGYQRLSRDHKRVTPLCPVHHRTGKDAVHAIGQRAFNEQNGFDLLELADRLWGESQKVAHG